MLGGVQSRSVSGMYLCTFKQRRTSKSALKFRNELRLPCAFPFLMLHLALNELCCRSLDAEASSNNKDRVLSHRHLANPSWFLVAAFLTRSFLSFVPHVPKEFAESLLLVSRFVVLCSSGVRGDAIRQARRARKLSIGDPTRTKTSSSQVVGHQSDNVRELL